MEQPRYEQVIKDKAIQAEINRVADSIDGLDRQGQNARAIRFYRPNPRGFSNGVRNCLLNLSSHVMDTLIYLAGHLIRRNPHSISPSPLPTFFLSLANLTACPHEQASLHCPPLPQRPHFMGCDRCWLRWCRHLQAVQGGLLVLWSPPGVSVMSLVTTIIFNIIKRSIW